MRLVQPVEANELFLAMPEALIAGLRRRGFAFHRWLAPPGETGPVVRMVTSFATPPEEVDDLVAAATRLAAQGLGIALVDEPGEEGQGGSLAVLTAPGPRTAQAAILPFQVERHAGLDARRPAPPRRRAPRRSGAPSRASSKPRFTSAVSSPQVSTR